MACIERRKTLLKVLLVGLLMLSGTAGYADAQAADKTLTVGAPECAHCLAMALMGPTSGPYNFTFKPFGTLTALTTSLLTNEVQIAQIDYPALVSLISKHTPIVAISGQVNGGTDLVLQPSIKVAAGDWAALRAYIMKHYSPSHKFRIGSNFGSVQDVDLRLRFSLAKIPESYVDIVNVAFPAMPQALKAKAVDTAVPVQPVAAEITTTGIATHFSYLYNQPAGNLTNVVIVSKAYLEKNPEAIKYIAKAMVKLVDYVSTDAGKQAWQAAIEKYTYIKPDAVKYALGLLSPDINMPIVKIKAIADGMYGAHLISRKLTVDEIAKYIDYKPLEEATGKTKAELGGG
ncbi:ABC transporter substrate-binding protein [Acidihalobacter ferrooxydans]|nr:ABC transporter substrate-binding protein [Acidihalobacter ferrooxydans]